MANELDKLLGEINKRYGAHSIVKASENKTLAAVQRVRTGIFGLDVALGGGVPVGGITILKGEYSSGKSVLALRIASAYQRHCRNCGREMFDWDETTQTGKMKKCCKDAAPMRVVWFDAEGCWSNSWAQRLGVDTDNCYVIRTEFAEQGIDVADAIIRSGECDLLVVDSVAALTPSVEIEQSSEKWQMGVAARLMNKAMRKWVSAQNAGSLGRATTCSVLLINQIRMKIGVIYGSPETSPGGKGLEFAASVIGKVKKDGFMEDDAGRAVGHWMQVAFVKNKTAPPNRTCKFSLAFVDSPYGEGDSRKPGASNIGHQILGLAEFWKLVKRSGSWYELAKGHRCQGAEAAAKWLEQPENKAVLDMLRDKIWEKEVGWLDGGEYA